MVAGYPLAAVLVSYTGMDTTAITVPYRLAVVSFALVIFASGLFFPLRGKPSVMLLIFLGLYLCRLLYDSYFADNEFAPDALQFFIVVTLIPVIAVTFALDGKFEERLFSSRLILAVAVSLLGFYALLYTGRVTIEIGSRASLAALNPISLGHLAATGVIVAILIVLSRRGIFWIGAAILTIAISIPALFFAGSRGPIIAMVAALMWLGTTDKRRALIIIPLMTAAFLSIPEDNFLLDRFMAVFNGFDRSSSARLEVQTSALADFFENPFLGKHFMDASFGEGSWPHNYFLESAMAMGIVGLAISVMLVLSSFKAAASSVNQTNPLLTALLVQALVAAQFSGSLWGGEKLFALIAAVLALGKINNSERCSHSCSDQGADIAATLARKQPTKLEK